LAPTWSVRRNDALNVQEAMAMRPAGIVLSPGPCDPDQAGICLALTQAAAETGTPLLGVCLGHQTIGQAFGGRVVRHSEIVHGKMGHIHHQGRGVFAGLPSPFEATRYHSLSSSARACPIAWRSPRNLRMARSWACRIKTCPSTACSSTPNPSPREHGHALLKTFLDQMQVPGMSDALKPADRRRRRPPADPRGGRGGLYHPFRGRGDARADRRAS
jgi:anthranilate synthase component 2